MAYCVKCKRHTETKSGEICTVITVLPSEKRQSFQSMIKSESLKRNLFLTRGIHHAGPKRFSVFFTVSEVHYTDPITYKLKDLNGEEIKGSFYEQELQNSGNV